MAALGAMATDEEARQRAPAHHGLLQGPADAGEKRELLGLIEDYARGLVPLIVPITLVNHYVNPVRVAYVRDQVYLRPHPKELMLRNHV